MELASGSGEHVTHFAAALGPDLLFQPSDPDPSARASVDAWVAELKLRNVQPAIELDAAHWPWPIEKADAIICVNMIHISPWASTVGLIEGAARILPRSGILYLYGPYRRDGQHTAPSNEAFDLDLRSRNPAWGIRNLEDVTDLATGAGFASPTVEQMPANNLSVIFRR